MAGAVPSHVVENLKYTEYFPEEQVKEVVDKIGIYQRRFADEYTCSSDLCFAAAQKLLYDNNINREEIDLLVFISQTPDYRMPATSITLQHRLGLSNDCIAFDINLGCSAFLYGMSVVYSMMQNGNIRKEKRPCNRDNEHESLRGRRTDRRYGLMHNPYEGQQKGCRYGQDRSGDTCEGGSCKAVLRIEVRA